MLFPSRSVSWLVVFLGNPGLRYEGTRHNAGFMTADAFARKKNISINRSRFRALTATCPVGNETVMLMKPQTYMNLSGEAVGQAARFYKIPADHVLVVSDDITLPIGALRIRTKGSAGGHNGLKSVAQHLGTQAFARVRVGVGQGHVPGRDLVSRVLGRIEPEDEAAVAAGERLAAEAALCVAARGAEFAMNKYNGPETVGA